MSQTASQFRIAARGEPVREILDFLPEQGHWSDRLYLDLVKRGVEFDNGMLEILPVPTRTHQLIVTFLFDLLRAFIAGRGQVYFAGYRLGIPRSTYREPDVLYLTAEQDADAGEQFTSAASLVIEVVSPDDPDRDYVTKREEYARANVPEYWIVDPQQRRINVLRLDNGGYVEHGQFVAGQHVTSHLLPGLTVAVDAVLSQGK